MVIVGRDARQLDIVWCDAQGLEGKALALVAVGVDPRVQPFVDGMAKFLQDHALDRFRVGSLRKPAAVEEDDRLAFGPLGRKRPQGAAHDLAIQNLNFNLELTP